MKRRSFLQAIGAGTPTLQLWYRYLNCGYRLTAAGGTDKMAASTPVGGNRTYAYPAGQEFSFGNWAAAMRARRTFATTGPLPEFRAGGGTPEVVVETTSFVPFQSLEVVLGTRQMRLVAKVTVKGSAGRRAPR